MSSFRFCFAIFLCILFVVMPARAATQATPPRTIKDLVVLLDQYKPDPARTAAIHQAMHQEPPPSASENALARFYLERARVAGEAGAIQQQIADLRRAVELGGDGILGRVYKELSAAEFIGGDFQNALHSRLKAIANTGQGSLGRLVNDYAQLSEMYRRLGQLDEAQKALNDAEGMFITLRSRSKNWSDLEHNWTSSYQDGRGRALLAAGKAHEAEVAFSDAMQEITLDIPINLQRIARGMDMPPPEQQAWARDSIELRLADALMQQNKLFDAEIHIRNSLQSSLTRAGRYSIQTASGVAFYARLLLEERRAAEAETMARAAIEILEQIGATPDSILLSNARHSLASSYVIRGQWRKALEQFQAIQDAHVGQYKTQLAGGDINWALALIKTGQADAARAMLEPLLATSIQFTGDKSTRSAELQGYLGLSLAKTGNRQKALGELQHALAVLIVARRDGQDTPSPVRQSRLTIIVDAYIALLAEIRGTPLEKSAGLDAAAEAFRMADLSRGQDVQQAVAEAAARSAAGTPELAALIRKSQDLRLETATLYRVLVDLISAPPERQLPQVIADMRKRIASIDKERQELLEHISRQFPAYADLVSPRPATLEQARSALRPGEALLSIVTTEEGSYVWAIPYSGPVAFVSSRLGQTEIAQLVTTLRKSLDTGDVELEQTPAFDLAAGYRLYAELLAPVEGGWKGAQNLLVSTGGALSQLPFALLPTSADTPATGKLLFGHLAKVPWLIRQTAVTQEPSINSFIALRQQKPGDPKRESFLGFGDPDFGSKAQVTAISRGINHPAHRSTLDKGSEWVDYSRIPPLPDTRDEILALAKALNADPARDVLLGAEASKANIQKMDLSNRRIIAFATHGLVAGDFPGVNQPSLALANPGDGKSGLLTLEEILGLKLDADWVVLSACNTAAGDGAGADAVSGLGRGFFYAGTRALLVTHWPVETVSARLLVTGTFSRYSADPGISRAEALRQSMLALIDSPGYINPATGRAAYSYAHPLFWAPYALVGDGGSH